MKRIYLTVIVALFVACGTEDDLWEDQTDADDVAAVEDGLAGKNPYYCVASCVTCIQRDRQDPRLCVKTGRRNIAKSICSGYTTPAKALPDCKAALPACSNWQVSVGSFTCK